MVKRILLDLDGVLGDWAGSAIRAHGRDPAQVFASWPAGVYDLAEALGVSTNEMWRPIHAAGSDFWADIEPYPWAHDLLRQCQNFAPTTILTAPSLDPGAAAGKVAWLQRMFGRSFRDYLIGPDKPACAWPGSVLIDDRDDGCRGFQDAGGHAIVFPRIWNSAREHAESVERDGPHAYIARRLDVLG